MQIVKLFLRVFFSLFYMMLINDLCHFYFNI
nr:MAG TPA: hypothetical protein [Caudoviricetes sp.]